MEVPNVKSTIGPMARSVKDVEKMMEFFVNNMEINMDVPHNPWRKVENPTRVGYFEEFDLLEVCPA